MCSDHLFQCPDSYTSKLIRHKAHQLVRLPGFCESDRPDVEQELALEVIRKYKQFDPSRAKENTFIARVIESKAKTLIRYRTAAKRNVDRESHSLNDEVRDGEGRSVQHAQILDASLARRHRGQIPRDEEYQRELQIDVAETIDSLPDHLRQITDLLQDETEHSVGCQLGRSRRDVSNDIERLHELCEIAGLHEYVPFSDNIKIGRVCNQ